MNKSKLSRVSFCIFIVFIISSVDTNTQLLTHSRSQSIKTFGSFEINSFRIKIRYDPALEKMRTEIDYNMPHLKAIASSLATLFNLNVRVQSIYIACASAYRNLRIIRESVGVFEQAHLQLPQYSIQNKAGKIVLLDLLPVETERKITELSINMLRLKDFAGKLTIDILNQTLDDEMKEELRFNFKSAQVISHNSFELRMSITRFILALSELFQIGKIRPSLIRTLFVLSSNEKQKLDFNFNDYNQLLGCMTSHIIECEIHREYRSSPKELNYFKGIPFDGCAIENTYLLDGQGVPHQKIPGAFDTYTPMAVDSCLTALLVNSLKDIKANCILKRSMDQHYQIIQGGIMFFSIHSTTVPILNRILGRTPEDTDLPLIVKGNLNMNFQNLQYKIDLGLNQTFYTLKHKHGKRAFCPEEDRLDELQTMINKIFLPIGGTSAFLGAIAFILIIIQYILMCLNYKKVKTNFEPYQQCEVQELLPINRSHDRIVRQRNIRPNRIIQRQNEVVNHILQRMITPQHS